MNSKKRISVLLFLTLLIQVLPLQQITAWFLKNQVTEELVHDINPVKAKSATDEAHPPFFSDEFRSRTQPVINRSQCGLHSDEALFNRLADDILTPPPNC